MVRVVAGFCRPLDPWGLVSGSGVMAGRSFEGPRFDRAALGRRAGPLRGIWAVVGFWGAVGGAGCGRRLLGDGA